MLHRDTERRATHFTAASSLVIRRVMISTELLQTKYDTNNKKYAQNANLLDNNFKYFDEIVASFLTKKENSYMRMPNLEESFQPKSFIENNKRATLFRTRWHRRSSHVGLIIIIITPTISNAP